MAKSPLEAYRRQLPHWRQPGATYCVNWRIHKFQADLDDAERGLVVSSIRHFEETRYCLHAYAVMNDHVHVIVKPHSRSSLENIVHSWKSYSSNRLQRTSKRTGRVWQEEYFDKIIRSTEHYHRMVKLFLKIRFGVGPISYPMRGLASEKVGSGRLIFHRIGLPGARQGRARRR
jgi:putative transposase